MILALVTGVAASALASNSSPFHWGQGDRPRAWFTIVDHTPEPWPVQAATNEWDFAGRVDVIYRFGGCGGLGHCVPVRTSLSGDFDGVGCNLLRGVFYRQFNGNHIIPSSARIRVNGRCENSQFTRQNRRGIVCHEEGHAMRLIHADTSFLGQTCMAGANAQQWLNRAATPRHHDFVMVDDVIYDHNH